jgi:transcriptional regulator with XRE-family HTH domain
MKNKDEKEDKITIEGELRVKELLEERGISMQDFAASIGIVRETLTRTLKGNPRYDTLKAIADGLGMTVPELFRSNRGQNIKPEKQVVHGYIEIGNEIYAIRNRAQYVDLMNKVDGIAHITSFKHEEDHKNAIKGFLYTSIHQGKSDAIMARYGLGEIYTLSYDSIAKRLSLTLCLGNGEIRFKTFDIEDYKTNDDFTHLELTSILEAILTEIEKIDNDN